MARLLLVEDHVLVRQSIRAFLEGEAFEVIGEASTGTEAVQLALDLQPDLVIMDIHLPEMNGIEATRRIRRQCPDMRIIALTAYNERAYQRALESAGAADFVLKTAEFSELLTIIKKVLESESERTPIPPGKTFSVDFRLTERERDVLTCATRGWTNKQIGVHLRISDRTVQVHLQAIYQKLEVCSRTEAVSRGLALGLIPMVDGEPQ
ncbi:MAG: response regulator transcription factor [Anaerolineae bacterium]